MLLNIALSDAGADPQYQPPPGPGVVVELSDKGRKLQELQDHSQPEPAAPVPELKLHIKRLNILTFVKTMGLLHPDLSGFDKDIHKEWSVIIANNLGKLF